VDLLLRADPLVETLPAFLAEPAPLQHLRKKLGRTEALPPGIVGDGFIQVLSDEVPDVEADDIH
jgi:hypothetical protein